MEVGIISKMSFCFCVYQLSAKDILRTIVLCTPFMFQVSCIIPLLFFKGHDLVPILNLRSLLGSSMSYCTVLRKSIRDSLVFRESIPNKHTFQKYQCVLSHTNCTVIY